MILTPPRSTLINTLVPYTTLLRSPRDLADQQREARIGERGLAHPHHDQPRCDEIAERHAHHQRPSASAQSGGKNDEIEQRRDRRCPDRLELDLEEPPQIGRAHV